MPLPLSGERRHWFEFSRYFLASLVALLVDMGVLLLCAQVFYYLFSVAIGFVLGALTHYCLSILFVFRQRRLHERRHLELLVFVAAGLLALLINLAVVYVLVESFGFPLLLAKLFAAGCSFVFAYAVRKIVLF